MKRSRKEMIKWLKEFIDDIRTQEIGINSTKTGAAALGVVSFIGLFTPFAPLAIGGMVASGGAAVATTVGDLIATKVKGGNLEKKISKMKRQDSDLRLIYLFRYISLSSDLTNLHKKIGKQAAKLAKELNISTEDATLFLLIGVPKMAAQLGVEVINGVIEIGRILPHLKAINDAMKLDASFTQAAKLSETVFLGYRVTATGGKVVAGAGTTLVITTATKALGGLGAVIGVADAIYSWSTKNPNRESAEELLARVEDNLKALEEMNNNLSN